VTRSPDTSGNFFTARVNGAIAFPGPNNGVVGKAAVASGGWLEVAHDPGLEPTDAITMEMTIRPAGDPDCDGENNFRFLLRKGLAYSLVLEETRGIRARVWVAGGQERALYSGQVIAADGATWTKIAAQYDAKTGRMQILFDGRVVAEQVFAPAPLAGTGESLMIGGLGPRPACGGGGLNFVGAIDEVSVSRVVRYAGGTPSPPDAGPPDGLPGGYPVTPVTDDGRAGCCQTGSGGEPAWLALVVLAWLRRPRRAA
jgi:uncharacterized protein (TIGR03382 family)